MWLSLDHRGFFYQLLTSPFVFQLQVANLLSNVFKLLMTHQVRSCHCLPSNAWKFIWGESNTGNVKG